MYSISKCLTMLHINQPCEVRHHLMVSLPTPRLLSARSIALVLNNHPLTVFSIICSRHLLHQDHLCWSEVSYQTYSVRSFSQASINQFLYNLVITEIQSIDQLVRTHIMAAKEKKYYGMLEDNGSDFSMKSTMNSASMILQFVIYLTILSSHSRIWALRWMVPE
jgi:hypothetical protein